MVVLATRDGVFASIKRQSSLTQGDDSVEEIALDLLGKLGPCVGSATWWTGDLDSVFVYKISHLPHTPSTYKDLLIQDSLQM